MSAELLQRARAGDRDAFTALVEPYRARTAGALLSHARVVQDAEDALQETLLAAWVGIEGFEGRSRFALGCTAWPRTGASTC